MYNTDTNNAYIRHETLRQKGICTEACFKHSALIFIFTVYCVFASFKAALLRRENSRPQSLA